ncbi:MAG: hypothetical protein WDW38_005981 [Sanguina aurantia]
MNDVAKQGTPTSNATQQPGTPAPKPAPRQPLSQLIICLHASITSLTGRLQPWVDRFLPLGATLLTVPETTSPERPSNLLVHKTLPSTPSQQRPDHTAAAHPDQHSGMAGGSSLTARRELFGGGGGAASDPLIDSRSPAGEALVEDHLYPTITHTVIGAAAFRNLPSQQASFLALLQPFMHEMRRRHPHQNFTREDLLKRMRIVDVKWLEKVAETGSRVAATEYLCWFAYDMLVSELALSHPSLTSDTAKPAAAAPSRKRSRHATATAKAGASHEPAQMAVFGPQVAQVDLIQEPASAGAGAGGSSRTPSRFAVAGTVSSGGGGGGRGGSSSGRGGRSGGGSSGDGSRVAAPARPLSVGSHRPSESAPMGRYAEWLGLGNWTPELDSVATAHHLMLFGIYNRERWCAVGNGALVKKLVELGKYEEALFGAAGNVEVGDTVNRHALVYHHAAAAVSGCSFCITRQHPAAAIKRLLPYCGGPFISAVVCELIATGSCVQLDDFREDCAVTDSKGLLRMGTQGASTRRQFKRLPGVGHATARQWYDAGCHSLEDDPLGRRRRRSPRAATAAPGGGWTTEGKMMDGSENVHRGERLVPANKDVAYSVKWHKELLEEVSAADVEEVLQALRSSLEGISGEGGWRIELVGGGARDSASHDADILVTHPHHIVDGVVAILYETWVGQGRLVPKEQGFCMMQAGKRRRCDIIVVPPTEWAVSKMGWTGSRQWLRFLRQHVASPSLRMNNHCILRLTDTDTLLVPEEAAPLDPQGNEYWPEGWLEKGKRSLETEEDIFQILRLPHRPASQRNIPC